MTTPTPAPDLKVYEVLVTALRAYPGNPRTSDVDALTESLRVNGQFRPIVVRKETHEILAGNHTWKAAIKLGWEKVRITFVEGITDDQAKRIVLADNRYSDTASYSVPDLTALLQSLPQLDNGAYDLLGTGYDNYVLSNMLGAFSGTEAPTVSGELRSEDVLKPLKTTTCPSCHHTWES